MNWADWAIIAILVLSVLISLTRGFVREALSLATWVAAFFVAVIFGASFSVLLTDYIDTPSVREMAAYALLFIGTLFVGSILSYLLGALIKATGLSSTDRLFGVVFGLARGVLMVMAILIFLPGLISIDQDSWWQSSLLIPHFLSFEGQTREFFSQTVEFLSTLFSQASH